MIEVVGKLEDKVPTGVRRFLSRCYNMRAASVGGTKRNDEGHPTKGTREKARKKDGERRVGTAR